MNCILDLPWAKYMKVTLEQQYICCVSYTANTMPSDALVTLEARASGGMVLLSKAGIFNLQHQKS